MRYATDKIMPAMIPRQNLMPISIGNDQIGAEKSLALLLIQISPILRFEQSLGIFGLFDRS